MMTIIYYDDDDDDDDNDDYINIIANNVDIVVRLFMTSISHDYRDGNVNRKTVVLDSE